MVPADGVGMNDETKTDMALSSCLGISEMGKFGEKKRNGFKSKTTYSFHQKCH